MAAKALTVQVAKDQTPIKPFTLESLSARAEAIFDEISNRAFEIFESNGHAPGHELEHWLQAEKELLHPVHIQVSESGDKLEVKAEVPGFTEKELEIKVEPQRLMISGKRETKKEEKKGKTLYSETCSDEIMRVVDLPTEVETEKVTATLKDGVLALTLPKSAKARTVRMEPNAA